MWGRQPLLSESQSSILSMEKRIEFSSHPYQLCLPTSRLHFSSRLPVWELGTWTMKINDCSFVGSLKVFYFLLESKVKVSCSLRPDSRNRASKTLQDLRGLGKMGTTTWNAAHWRRLIAVSMTCVRACLNMDFQSIHQTICKIKYDYE